MKLYERWHVTNVDFRHVQCCHSQSCSYTKSKAPSTSTLLYAGLLRNVSGTFYIATKSETLNSSMMPCTGQLGMITNT